MDKHKKFCIQEDKAIVVETNKKIVLKDATDNLEESLIKENEIIYIVNKIVEVPKSIEKKHKDKQTCLKKISYYFVLLFFSIVSLLYGSIPFLSICGFLIDIWQINVQGKKFQKLKKEIAGLECQLYFLQIELLKKEQELTKIKEEGKKLKNKTSPLKKICDKEALEDLKSSMLKWKKLGLLWEKYIQRSMNGELTPVQIKVLEHKGVNPYEYERFMGMQTRKREKKKFWRCKKI